MSQPPPVHRQPGDAWVECRCGHRHWGLHGAAGLLLVRRVEHAGDGTGRPDGTVGPDTVGPGTVGPGGDGAGGTDPAAPTAHEVVLQHRVGWSHHGGTWGVPGGALAPGEDAVTGALREAAEEAGIDPDGLEVVTTRVLDHVDWSYTTVVARVTGPQAPHPTDGESEAIVWVATDAVADLPLLPAFADAWPGLRALADAL